MRINPKAQARLEQPTGTNPQTSPGALVGSLLATSSHPVLQAIAALHHGDTRTLNFDGAYTFKIRKAQFIDQGFLPGLSLPWKNSAPTSWRPKNAPMIKVRAILGLDFRAANDFYTSPIQDSILQPDCPSNPN